MSKGSQNGFTLVEMIMVIVITGILGAIVAVFLRAPVQQYMDVARRAALTDVADIALYQLAGDISTAVPNSVRVAGCGGSPCVEFLPTRDGGRYRASAAGGAGSCAGVAGNTRGDALNFNAADTCFEIIGAPVVFVAGDQIVLGSTQSDGNPPYNSTNAGILRAYTGAAGAQVSVRITGTQFPAFAELASRRFDVVDGTQGAVTYACEGVGVDANGSGTGVIRRYWGYGYNVAQVNPPGGASAILASGVSGCSIDYTLPNQHMGLIGIRLALSSSGETVSLYHEIHVNNAP